MNKITSSTQTNQYALKALTSALNAIGERIANDESLARREIQPTLDAFKASNPADYLCWLGAQDTADNWLDASSLAEGFTPQGANNKYTTFRADAYLSAIEEGLGPLDAISSAILRQYELPEKYG